jgi:hypothetical protein
MSEEITKVGMKPAHPRKFIREEILAELDCPWPALPKFWAFAAPPCPTS